MTTPGASAPPRLSASLAARLDGQLAVVGQILQGAAPADLRARPPSGKWSAHENLAHLVRHHEVMGERLRRILDEDAPALPRYRAEDDPDWPRVAVLPTAETAALLYAARERLAGSVRRLTAEELDRTGSHPVLGVMTVVEWLEFFLLHEAHHLYLAWTLAGSGRARLR